MQYHMQNNNIEINELTINTTHCVFLADIHLGVRQNSEEWQQNHYDYFHNFFCPFLRNTKQSLKATESLIVFILGDINDNRKAIDINVHNLAINIIAEISEICDVYLMTGNHDLSKKTNKGNNSIRALSYMTGVHVITQPTYITVQKELTTGIKELCHIIAVPYLGDFNEETKYLVHYKDNADYAFLHTEITKMQMDNGMSITNGINPDAFNGKIISGHIHKRQETKKVIYVGSPFQMSRGDINNEKGIYVLNFKNKKLTYTPNNYSPLFQNIYMDDFLKLTMDERKSLLDNNYNFILIDESKLASYKKVIDIYDMKAGTNARTVRPVINRIHPDVLSNIDISVGEREKTIDELIVNSINALEVSDDEKNALLKLNNEYFKAAKEQLNSDI